MLKAKGDGKMLFKNRKGIVNHLIMILVIGVVLAVLILLFWAGSMVLPILTGTGNLLISQIRTSVSNSPDADLVNATNTATSLATNVLGVVEGIVYVFFIIMVVGFILLAYYVRTYPFLAFVWIFILIILVFVSMFVSNAYQTASLDGNLQEYYSTWGGNDFLMNYLPHLVGVVGLMGGIFLFILASREPESEVQQL